MSNYIGCTVCGARWEEPQEVIPSGCIYCGSSSYILERNLSPEVEKVLREYGTKPGIPSVEEHDPDPDPGAFHWF